MGAGTAPNVDVYRLNDVTVLTDSFTLQANVGDFVITAAGRTARPVDTNRLTSVLGYDLKLAG